MRSILLSYIVDSGLIHLGFLGVELLVVQTNLHKIQNKLTQILNYLNSSPLREVMLLVNFTNVVNARAVICHNSTSCVLMGLVLAPSLVLRRWKKKPPLNLGTFPIGLHTFQRLPSLYIQLKQQVLRLNILIPCKSQYS